MLCPDLCTSFFHVSLGRYRSTLAAYDEQQHKSELTFITSAFPSKFFACKQAKYFHEFVVEVLPVNYSHCSSQYHIATQHRYMSAQSGESVFLLGFR